jgi:hypothetical protein
MSDGAEVITSPREAREAYLRLETLVDRGYKLLQRIEAAQHIGHRIDYCSDSFVRKVSSSHLQRKHYWIWRYHQGLTLNSGVQ